MRILRALLNGTLVLLLLATAYLGLTEGFPLVREAHSGLQRLATGTEILYGVTALLALVGLAARRRWALAVLAIWGAAITATSTLAPVVWGQSPWTAGVTAGLATAALLALLVWGLRTTARRAAGTSQPGSAA